MRSVPPDWDLLVAGDRLVGTLFELALDANCPARRFALHCLYIYAADAIRTKFRAHPKRRLRKLVEQAEDEGDELLATWAHNTRVLLRDPRAVRLPRLVRGRSGPHAPAAEAPARASGPPQSARLTGSPSCE